MAKIRILAIFLLLLLDRITKWFILIHPNLYLGDFVEMKLFKNEKLFFLSFGEHTNLIISLVSILVLIPFYMWIIKAIKEKKSFLTFSLFLIIFGGLDNIFDRIYYGFVIDWINISIFPFSVFNIADIMIVSGIICLIFNLKKYK